MAKQRYKRAEPLQAWRKNRQVTLQAWSETGTDSRGHSTGSWGNLAGNATVWASVQPLTTRTAEYAHQLYAQATHRVLIDYRSDIKRGMRVVYGSRTLHIGHITELMDSRTVLELLCSEGDPYGD